MGSDGNQQRLMDSDANAGGRPSPMNGSLGSCWWSWRGNKHEDRTGRQLDFSSEYYQLWLSYLYYYRKNISENMRSTCSR